MTATPLPANQPLSSVLTLTPPVPPPVPYFPKKFWIMTAGEPAPADADEVQILVNTGLVNLDIMSQDPGSTWTKPAALGFASKSTPSALKPTPIVPAELPAAPTSSPMPFDIPVGLPAKTDLSSTTQRKQRAARTATPLSTPPTSRPSREAGHPLVLRDFASALEAGLQTGVTFRLSDGRAMASPIPETDAPITADVVRKALAHVEREYNRRGLALDSTNLAETQESVVLLAAFLNFRVMLNGGPASRYLIQSSTAVADFQHTLRIVINTIED